MKPIRTFAATLTVTGAILATVAVVAPAGHAATTMTFHATETSAGTNPALPAAFKVGTIEAFSEALTDTSGSSAGYDTFSCAVVRVLNATKRAGLLECNGTARLKDGTLVMQGLVWQNNTDSRLAVVGGTGAYEAAAGSVLISAPDVDTTKLTINLR